MSTIRKRLKGKLRDRRPVLATWTSFGHPQIAEVLTRCNVDFLGIDIEHSTISQSESQRIIAASHGNGVVCLPRVATHNLEEIKRVLDSGADGIIVPMVSTTEQIDDLVRWMKYPPLGSRGFGIARAQGYGYEFQEYISEWNEESILIIQIESIEAVRGIGALLSNREVDGAMIGPYDISGSLGIPGQLGHPSVRRAASDVVDACREAGKACGTQIVDPDPVSVREAFELGYTFVVLASDVFILWKWGQRMSEITRQYG